MWKDEAAALRWFLATGSCPSPWETLSDHIDGVARPNEPFDPAAVVDMKLDLETCLPACHEDKTLLLLSVMFPLPHQLMKKLQTLGWRRNKANTMSRVETLRDALRRQLVAKGLVS